MLLAGTVVLKSSQPVNLQTRRTHTRICLASRCWDTPKHLLSENRPTVFAIIALGQVSRAPADSCANVARIRPDLPSFGFPSVKCELAHPFRAPACNKPFPAYQKCSGPDLKHARELSLSQNRFARDNRIRPWEDGQSSHRSRLPGARNPNPPIPSKASVHRIRQLLPTASFGRGHTR